MTTSIACPQCQTENGVEKTYLPLKPFQEHPYSVILKRHKINLGTVKQPIRLISTTTLT